MSIFNSIFSIPKPLCWSIVRLIWVREMRDQLRDRRTIFMIVVLPIILYPILGFVVLEVAIGLTERPGIVGIDGIENLPKATPTSAGFSPVPAATWFALTPRGSGASGLPLTLVGDTGLIHAARIYQDTPPLLVHESDGAWRFPAAYFDSPGDSRRIEVLALHGEDPRTLLDEGKADMVLIVPPDFQARLAAGERAEIKIEGEDRLGTTQQRVQEAVSHWKQLIKQLRLLQHGLPADFDDPVALGNRGKGKLSLDQAAKDLEDMLIRVFPFMLVMWSLAGAMYPAVDLCAGEKERGTMETLLISPAGREEIVLGKFLTIWVFSVVATVWNLTSMSLTTGMISFDMAHSVPTVGAFVWCVVATLPLAALFSALCLAIAIHARSSKEGQHYLMPLFLITLPLVFVTLAPGVKLNLVFSMVPVSGVALLMQRVMAARTLSQVPWLYFFPVLAGVVFYSWLALRWAVMQFHREEVLFREAEHFDLRVWLRRLIWPFGHG